MSALPTNAYSRVKRAAAWIPGARWLWRRVFPPPPYQPVIEPVPLSRPSDRGPPPTADRAALAERYRRSALSREPDTFVLYRIVGNDLPPRHAPDQSLRNLRFVLDYEPPLSDCEKRFVVNRIADPAQERAILDLLEGAGVTYLHIPLEPDVYRSITWDAEGLPPEYAPWTTRFTEISPGQRGRALMRLYRHKNNYVMNNNGARNAALREGRTLAKWVLPWDGNCFLTASAWREITDAVRAAPEFPYFVVPMARVADNAELLRGEARPEAAEEPQIVFRRDAMLEFDREYQYGRRPKVNLLWRLGVPGEWDGWAIEPWDHPCPPYADEAGAFRSAGWVARLFSGQAALEGGDEGTATIVDRGLARVEAVKGLLDRLDAQIGAMRVERGQTCMIAHEPTGQSEAIAVPASLLEKLRAAAEEALTRGPYSVVEKTSLPPSRNRHDYWHPAPYYWPHPWRIPWKPYVRRDGRRVPGTNLYGPLSERYDRTRLQRLFDDTFVLALAWRYLGDTRYGQHAARLVRTWFLTQETAMTPHLEYAQVRRGHDDNKGTGQGIVEMKDLYYFLDGVVLLERGNFISPHEQDGLRSWFARYLHWLITSPHGRSERAATNNHGTYYDLQVLAIAAYLGEGLTVRSTLRDSRCRILAQFCATGLQPEEMARTTTAHYCCFNLQGWIHIATIAESTGEDIWSFEGSDGRGIRRSMEWLLSHMGSSWPYAQIDEFDAARFEPIRCVFAQRYGEQFGRLADVLAQASKIQPLFHPYDGIMPFWQIGKSVHPYSSTSSARVALSL